MAEPDDGICDACNGDGGKYASDFYGTTDGWSWMECPVCHGLGRRSEWPEAWEHALVVLLDEEQRWVVPAQAVRVRRWNSAMVLDRDVTWEVMPACTFSWGIEQDGKLLTTNTQMYSAAQGETFTLMKE
jgi:hypothetical protein